MTSAFLDFITSNYKDLMLWHSFGVSRGEGHYGDGEYFYQANSEEGAPGDPDYLFDRCDFLSLEHPESYGLRRVDGKLYWVYKISHNIHKDREVFLACLCCYDFTDAVRHLLTCAVGGPQTAVSNRSLLPLITADGTYVVQYDFDKEVHAFVLLKEGDRVTVVNFYSGDFYIVKHAYYELLEVLQSIEQNMGDNRPLVKKLFGMPELYPNSEYHVASLSEYRHWDTMVDVRDYKRYLADVIAPLFTGREEEAEIHSQYMG